MAPALDLADPDTRQFSGQGVISVLDATFLLWLLAELFERLSAVGDLDRPRLMFFFDEAHFAVRHRAQSLVGGWR